MNSALVTYPQNLSYEKDENGYLFNVIFSLDALTNCLDTNGNGVNDPAEYTNGDGVFNQDDCILSTLEPTVFAFTQQ